jgi:large conductance mechanosensitive channel
MKGFIYFLRTQGVVGLAIGFIIGGAAQQFVKSLSDDILTPVVGAALGQFGELRSASSTVAGITLGWGNFVSSFINLLLIALVVYIFFKSFKLERLDTKKEV